jgi:hypothetical protein
MKNVTVGLALGMIEFQQRGLFRSTLLLALLSAADQVRLKVHNYEFWACVPLL